MQGSIEALLDQEKQDAGSVEHIKKTAGTKAFLRRLGTEETVRYPGYWNCVQKGTVGMKTGVKRKQIDPQSSAFKEIDSLIQRTWEADKVGHGQDAVGLHHSRIVVKKVWSVENPVLFRKFDAKKKEVCLHAADDRCPPVKGLRTDCHGT